MAVPCFLIAVPGHQRACPPIAPSERCHLEKHPKDALGHCKGFSQYRTKLFLCLGTEGQIGPQAGELNPTDEAMNVSWDTEQPPEGDTVGTARAMPCPALLLYGRKPATA